MENKRYIGVTGYMTEEELFKTSSMLQKEIPADGKKWDFLFMAGVLASLKTLNGRKNKQSNRYPKIDSIKDIFRGVAATRSDGNTIRIIHYNTKDINTLYVQLMALTELIGQHSFDGFQLNIPWPPERDIYYYRKRYPNKKIILQIGSKAFEDINHSPEELAMKLCTYHNLIDYILLDASGGEGKLLNAVDMMRYIECIKSCSTPSDFWSDLGVGVSGGLSIHTMDIMEPIWNTYPEISIDAEGKLRDDNDNLDLQSVEGYLIRSIGIHEKVTKKDLSF